ncbi:hypothetical protein ACGFX4_06505 [Kitasatospora sp. NPDC048365]|uniref:hypothetical protein n=1 Tax=Kitasatospora sp. NPDC048365 TaxID=3364050 RepID=UPI003717A4A9
MLNRLLRHRRVGAAEVSASSGLAVAEVEAVLSGAPASGEQVDALARAFGLYPDDLRVIAKVPAGDAPVAADLRVGREVVEMITVAGALSGEERARLVRLAHAQPRVPQAGPAEPPPRSRPRPEGFGAVLVELARVNRGLGGVLAVNRALRYLIGGRIFLSHSTIHGIEVGNVALRTDLVTGFAALLGIDPGDLAAMAGVAPGDTPLLDLELAGEIAELLRSCRGLTLEQVEHVQDEAWSMLTPLPADFSRSEWHLVGKRDGQLWGVPNS